MEPFTHMLTFTKQKNNDMVSWLGCTFSKNELLPQLPPEIWHHIMTFIPRDPRMNSHKFALRKWLYNNDDGSIPKFLFTTGPPNR